MSNNYDNWEILVEAVLRREKVREIALSYSRESSFSSLSSSFSFGQDPSLHEQNPQLDAYNSTTVNLLGGKMAPQVSSFLGKAGMVGLKKAVEVLDTLGSSMTNLNSGGFTTGVASGGNRISILAFEVANTIAKGANLLQSLSDENIQFLKKEVLHSEGIQQLVSTDMNELLSIAASDKREEFDVFSREVIRFGNLCKDPQWHNLDRFFSKLDSDIDIRKKPRKAAEMTMQELSTLSQHTSELYHELQVLDILDQDYWQKLEEIDSLHLPRKGETLTMLQSEVKHQRKLVRSLKKKSLWCKSFKEVMAKLVDVVTFILPIISEAFGDNGLTSPRRRSGFSHLSYHNFRSNFTLKLVMPPKYPSGAQKRKRKEKEMTLVQSQAGDMDKYFHRNKKKESEETVETFVIEEQQNMEESIENVVDDVHHTNLNEEGGFSFNFEDPGNWKNIDQKMRDYLVEMGLKRVNGILFPKDGANRHFDCSQYTRLLPNGQTIDRKWLVYSVSLDRIFCFCCKLFKTPSTMNKIGQLGNDGYKDWHNQQRSIKSHEGNEEHIRCMSSWIDLENRLQTKNTIDRSVQLVIDEEKKHWREVLTRIIAIVKRLAKNSLAFRGDDEQLYLENNGLFLQMVEMVAEFDPIMQEHIRRAKAREIHYTYLGKSIQNELIQMLAGEVRSSIVKKVRHAKYFSVLLDCTPDASHEEQMSLVIRCVDDLEKSPTVEEYWLEFLKVDDTSGLGLSLELQNVLINLELDIDDIRGQGYDNGANMSGRHKGVQKRLLEINPRAFYTPCGCHSLNLALCDMVNCCPKALSFFGVIQRIYTLFASSPKRWKIFKDKVEGLTVKPLSQTRWESHVESVKPIKEQTAQIRDALLDLADITEDGKTKSEAESLATYELENFEFLLGMVIWYRLLYAINTVSKYLQAENMDVDGAINLLQGLVMFLDDYRENGFAIAIDEAKTKASEMGIEAVFREKRVIRRKKQFDESGSDEENQSAEESFRVDYFLFIVDQARSSLQTRFQQFKQLEETFGFLFSLEKLYRTSCVSLLKSCNNLEQYLTHNGHSDINGDDLCSELTVLKSYLPSEAKKAIDVLHYLKTLDGCFPNAYIAYKILLTIPVTVASAERSFSKLKLIKTYLRSTMSQERLNGLAMISIEKEIVEQLDYSNLINIFASKTARRVVFK